MPSLTPYVAGDYTIRSVVTDRLGMSSAPDEVVSTRNSKSMTAAGMDQPVTVRGTTAQLDGRQSFDPDGDPLSFRWGITDKPATSLAELDSSTAETSRFVADEPGTSIVSLLAISAQTRISQALHESIITINGLPPEVLNNDNNGKTLSQQVAMALGKVEQGAYQGALEQLEHAVLARLNGCAKGGAPDKNDWILDCGAQAQSYPLIIEAMGLIESLL